MVEPKVKSELIILSADDPKQLKLGLTMTCYSGVEIHPILDGEVQKEIIKDENGLHEGMKVEAWGGVWTVIFDTNGPYLDSPRTRGMLEFNQDDRECWVCGGLINKRCIKGLVKKVSIVS